jgi:hypothetical protein
VGLCSHAQNPVPVDGQVAFSADAEGSFRDQGAIETQIDGTPAENDPVSGQRGTEYPIPGDDKRGVRGN